MSEVSYFHMLIIHVDMCAFIYTVPKDWRQKWYVYIVEE